MDVENLNISNAAAKWSPCIYHGAILCDDCEVVCDMREGRNEYIKAFIAGFHHSEMLKVI